MKSRSIKAGMIVLSMVGIALSACGPTPTARATIVPLPTREDIKPQAQPTAQQQNTLPPPEPTPTIVDDLEVTSYQEYFNQALGISSIKIELTRVEQVAEAVKEVYDSEGNLMIVSQSGVNRLAPFGLSLEPESNIWQRWQGAEGWKNLYELDDYPELHRQLAEYVQTHLIEPVTSEKNETLYGAGEGFTFHTRVNPEKANDIYKAFLDAFSKPEYQEAKKYWQSIGVTNGEQLLHYLRNNVGGPENKQFWLPAESMGHSLYLVLGEENSNSGAGQYREIAEQTSGFYLDQIPVVAFSFADYHNPFIKGWIQYIWEMNPHQVLIAYGAQGSQKSCWGISVNPFTQRAIFMLGNPEYSPSLLALDKRSVEVRYLGGKDYIFEEEDVGKIEAYTKAYLEAYNSEVYKGIPPGINVDRIVIDGANFGSPFEQSIASYKSENWFLPATH